MDLPSAKALEQRVAGYAAEHVPALRGARVVLAASGGADSAAMAALLCESGVVEPARAAVAHFDHALRGRAAAHRDVDAVRDLCSRYGLTLETSVWHTPQRGEAAARVARYQFLRGLACARDARAVITGHTSDDQVETVLIHAIRGAGLHGLAGMAPVGPLPSAPRRGIEVWRPLLGVSREETRAYCAARGLAYEDDATNEDRGFMRNRVRLELLPLMESVAPDARAALLSLSAEARGSAAALDAIAAEAIMLVEGAPPYAPEVALSRDALRRLPADAVAHAYRLALVRLLGDARDFGRVHYAMLAAAVRGATGSALELPRAVVATVDADAVVLSIGAPGPAAIAPDFAAALPYRGGAGAWEIDVGPYRDDVRRVDAPALESTAIIELPVGAVVRGRRPGDRVALRGGGHKKLQDLYVDAKVPRRERDAAPVIACGSDVLWTPLSARSVARAPRRLTFPPPDGVAQIPTPAKDLCNTGICDTNAGATIGRVVWRQCLSR